VLALRKDLEVSGAAHLVHGSLIMLREAEEHLVIDQPEHDFKWIRFCG
jgi:hypothetical protein